MSRAIAWLLPGLLTPALALAVTTQSFLLDTSEAFEKGKLEGAAIYGDGRVTRGVISKRMAVEGAAVAYASAVGPDGAIYVGTGNQGNVYRIDKSGHTLFARTDAPLVSALLWVGDTLYAGTLERGKVLAIDRKGLVKEHAALPGAAHVWMLAYDAPRATLFAATGPEGKLFAIPKHGVAKVVHDDTAEHLLALAIDKDGRKYVGTSNGARLLRITEGTVSVLYDAPGQELTALDLGPGVVVIASNEFPDAAGSDVLKDSRNKRGKPGKGKVFAVGLDGLVEELYRSDASHVTALEVEASGAVNVGLAQDGRIIRVEKGQPTATWADADERQIVSIHLAGTAPHFVSSDGVAVYRVEEPNKLGAWTSAALDAKVPARFGELRFRKRGDVHVATRTGNTETPDESWSPWSSELAADSPIRSPAARFLQLRASLGENAELYAVEAFYLPQNLPAYVRNVRATPERGNDKPVSAVAGTTAVSANKSSILINWDIDNPDGDRLRYRVFYAREGQTRYLPVQREDEILDKNELRWETLSVPDGHYRVRVEATDELSTPDPFVQKHEATSAPVLVDNHAPAIQGLRFAEARLTGKAADTLGPISQLEFSIDGASFRPIASRDGLLDTKEESFDIPLRALGPGPHVVAVRATDAARNSSTSAIETPP